MKMIMGLIYPVLLVMAPVFLYQIVMSVRRKRSTSVHYLWSYVMMLYLWMVFSVTGMGTVWDMIRKGGLEASFRQANISLIPFQSEGAFTYCMNIVMLMPLGFLLPYIWKQFRSIAKTAVTGLTVSAMIEFSQIFTNRLVDVDDLIMNTIGAMLGYIIWKAVGKYFFHRQEVRRTQSLSGWEPIIYIISAYAFYFLLYNWTWFI